MVDVLEHGDTCRLYGPSKVSESWRRAQELVYGKYTTRSTNNHLLPWRCIWVGSNVHTGCLLNVYIAGLPLSLEYLKFKEVHRVHRVVVTLWLVGWAGEEGKGPAVDVVLQEPLRFVQLKKKHWRAQVFSMESLSLIMFLGINGWSLYVYVGERLTMI